MIALAPEANRTFFFWHVFVEGLPPGTCYAWRMDGPQDTEQTGRRFDPRKDLLDPWARAVSDASGTAPGRRSARTGHASLRALVTEHRRGSRASSPRGLDGAVIYELHVGGFTRHPSSGVEHPGTFAGLIEKIPYLRELGVTHVELLPVMAFDEQDVPPPAAARGLRNYWGYSTHSFYSPHPRYCSDPARAAHEFRALTDALARRGHRRAARRRLQSHRRGRRVGPGRSTSRASPMTSSTSSTRPTGVATATSPAAATPSTAITRW